MPTTHHALRPPDPPPPPITPTITTCRRGDPTCTGGCVCGAACTHPPATSHPTQATPVRHNATVPTPQPGDTYRVEAAASVQFGDDRSILFRVIRIHDWTTIPGWAWLDGYQLDSDDYAIERRSIYVQVSGLRKVTPRAAGPSSRSRRAPAA